MSYQHLLLLDVLIPPWKADTGAASTMCRALYGPVTTLVLSEEPVAGPYTEPDEPSPCSLILRSISVLTSHICKVFPNVCSCQVYSSCWECFLFFLGVFAKLLKATVSFVMYVCPPARPHGTTWPPLSGGFACEI